MRLLVLVLLSAWLFAGLSYRIVQLAYLDRSYYQGYLESARRVREVRRASRGRILDRNGTVLAMTVPKIDLGIDPYAAETQDFAKLPQLSEILKISEEDLKKFWTRESRIVDNKVRHIRWKKITEMTELDAYEQVLALKIKGIYGITSAQRYYPNGALASHVIGFVNKEGIAVSGIEAFMDPFLRGQDGGMESKRDGRRQELPLFREIDVLPQHGSDIQLTIDIRFHSAIERILSEAVERFHAQRGTVLVSDPTNGDLLVMCNYPTFEGEHYMKADVANLRNCAVTDTYEPGSVFKIVPFSVALQDRVISLYDAFDCTSTNFTWQGKTYTLPKDHTALGKLSAIDVLRKSSNRGAAQIGIRLGANALYDAARAFGFGEKTGYGFDGEVAGILRSPKYWDGLTITRLPMGHAVSATALQVHCAMGVIASGGYLLSPQIVQKVLNTKGEVVMKTDPRVRRSVLTSDTVRQLRDILYHPDAKPSEIDGVRLAYKTGTTQKLVHGAYSQSHHISSCSGFFPAEAPKYLVTVVIDDARLASGSTAYGSKVAFPIFCDVARWLLRRDLLND
ncbi:MAG: penicillin-binding protein 2 [Verrucomicrobiota bacterium]|nr:MAG: penicillin-binding protein 2 [Verrucomicrobiota bacterium]